RESRSSIRRAVPAAADAAGSSDFAPRWGREVRSWFDLFGYGKAAAGTARGPAADDAGEHPGIAAGTDDHQPARTELVDGFAGERRRSAFNAPGSSDEVVPPDLAQP